MFVKVDINWKLKGIININHSWYFRRSKLTSWKLPICSPFCLNINNKILHVTCQILLSDFLFVYHILSQDQKIFITTIWTEICHNSKSQIQVPNPCPKSKFQSPEERDWDWGWHYNPTECQSSDRKRPSMNFHDLLWPLTNF